MRIGLLGILVLAGLLSAYGVVRSAPGEQVPRCARGFQAKGPAGLPAGVVLRTRCARFVVRDDGSVATEPLPPTPAARIGSQDLGGGYSLARSSRRHDGHLLILHDGETLWRSSNAFERASMIWGVLGKGTFAFADGLRLYLADFGRPERVVAEGEQPVGWSRANDLYTFRGHRRRDVLRLRDRTGRLLGTVATGVHGYRFEDATRTVLYQRTRALFRADGLRSRKLADLSSLGFRHGGAWTEPIDAGLIGVNGQHGTAVLDSSGRVFGRVGFPVTDFTPAADDRAVAFPSANSIYVLERGGTTRRVYRSPVSLEGCGGPEVDLAWRGRWLLVNAYGQGRLLAVDTATGRRVDLTNLVRQLPSRWSLQVSWS